MTTEKKLTKRDYFKALAAEIANKSEVAGIPVEKVQDFIANELELLARKNATSSNKPTKTQIENEHLKDVIYGVLAEANDWLTITEIGKRSPELAGLSVNKINGVVRIMVGTDHTVERCEFKRVAKFRLVQG